jgi:hypothetical protein
MYPGVSGRTVIAGAAIVQFAFAKKLVLRRLEFDKPDVSCAGQRRKDFYDRNHRPLTRGSCERLNKLQPDFWDGS